MPEKSAQERLTRGAAISGRRSSLVLFPLVLPKVARSVSAKVLKASRVRLGKDFWNDPRNLEVKNLV
jgi:hypothetical protein